MFNFALSTYTQQINFPLDNVRSAIDMATEKSCMGNYMVCVTNEKQILVLPEYTALVRDDIDEVIFETEKGYSYSIN